MVHYIVITIKYNLFIHLILLFHRENVVESTVTDIFLGNSSSEHSLIISHFGHCISLKSFAFDFLMQKGKFFNPLLVMQSVLIANGKFIYKLAGEFISKGKNP